MTYKLINCNRIVFWAKVSGSLHRPLGGVGIINIFILGRHRYAIYHSSWLNKENIMDNSKFNNHITGGCGHWRFFNIHICIYTCIGKFSHVTFHSGWGLWGWWWWTRTLKTTPIHGDDRRRLFVVSKPSIRKIFPLGYIYEDPNERQT